MAPARKKKPKSRQAPFGRLGWSRSPVQRPHSTPKGSRGYDRARAKKSARKEIDGESNEAGD